MGRFDEFIYRIPKRYSEWGDVYASPRAYFNGGESLWGANLRMGFTVVMKETCENFPHTHHSVEEYYMFSGSDLCNFFDFDAEIEFWVGENPDEMEKYVITKPTLIRIPPRMWHGPINYKRVGKPVAFSSMYFDSELCKITRRINPDDSVDYVYIGSSQKKCVFDKTQICSTCGRCVKDYLNNDVSQPIHPRYQFALDWAKEIVETEPAPHSGKYDKLFFEYPVEYHNYGDIYANPRGKFRGLEHMPDCRFYGGFTVNLKESRVEVPHFHHAQDEYLWFIGANLEDPFDFDAEIEIQLGWNPDDMETITITEPSVVRVPPNMWHCPIVYKKVNKPFGFFPVYYDGDWSKVLRKPTEDGDYEYIFEAASLRRCSYNHDEICHYCGKCVNDPNVPSFGVYTYKKKGDKK